MLTGIIILLVLGLNVYLLNKQVNIGLIMLLDSIMVILMYRVPMGTSLNAAIKGITSYKTVELILILFIISILENIMRITGMIKGIGDSLKQMVRSNRVTAAAMPAVIGMLPSPGGARLSCPMVEEIVGTKSDSSNKAFVNYWFRHIWLDGFMLYPGCILASSLVGVSPVRFTVYVLPFTLAAIVVGIFMGATKIKKENIANHPDIKGNLKKFLISFSPMLFLLSFYVFLSGFTAFALVISSSITVTMLFIFKKYSLKRVGETLRAAFSPRFILIIVGVMVFKEILFASGALDGLPLLIERYHIPRFALFITLPMIAGFSSGISVSLVSLTYPLLLPLGLTDSLWYGVIAYVAGSIGSMISPVHLCSVMTADYFDVPLNRMLLKTMQGESFILAAIIVAVFLLQ